MALKAIQPGQVGGRHGIHLTMDDTGTRHRHRERTEIVQQRTRQPGFPVGPRPGQPGMVDLTAHQGAVDEDEVLGHRPAAVLLWLLIMTRSAPFR